MMSRYCKEPFDVGNYVVCYELLALLGKSRIQEEEVRGRCELTGRCACNSTRLADGTQRGKRKIVDCVET